MAPRDCQFSASTVATGAGHYRHTEQEGLAKATLRRAADEIGLEKPRDGFGKGSVVYWRLPFGHPALNPAATNKTPGGK